MAPSTATPSDLHRAPVACLQCRKAKVRCLVSQRLDRCNRCISNDSPCVFTQPKRARVRPAPYARPTPPRETSAVPNYAGCSEELPSTTSLAEINEPIPILHTPTATSHHTTPVHGEQQDLHSRQPLITDAIRTAIITALASLKGRRGSSFSFITAEDGPSFSTRAGQRRVGSANSFQQSPTPVSLKLSTLLRPLTSNSEHGSSTDGSGSIPAGAVKMPSYSTSMSLGQTITDPIEGGMISLAASRELYEFFMFQMNAKWEYILDPRVDTHDQIRQRSQLLFATILFGASKFANHVNGRIVSIPDPVLQTRLCSLARNLVVRALAEGDRSIETMQALYLLVCWKDGDDDVSYLHSGYAHRVLQDMDLEQSDGDGWQRARRRRTWLALFRQDRQQRLFFMRRASLAQNYENHYLISNPNTWLEMECALPLDMIACGSAGLRRIQSKLRHLVERASSEMLPCLLDLMHGELSEWKAKWSTYLLAQGGTWTGSSSANASLDPELLFPDTGHLRNLIDIWDHSVRLNISSAVLRQSLMAAVTSSLDSPIPRHSSPDTFTFPDLDLPTLQRVLSPDLPGLSTSVEGAFGVLRHLLCIPPNDLRRAPDAVLLLAPNAALFLCLLLCLPENGILGMTFQRTAVTLIHDIARHVGNCVQSPQDTVVLHTAYLGSLVGLLNGSQQQQQQQGLEAQPPMGIPPLDVGGNGLCLDSQPIRPPQVLAGGYSMDNTSSVLGSPGDSGNNLHLQSVANLLDGDLFWEMPLTSESGGVGD